jgi:hypothetical protein
MEGNILDAMRFVGAGLAMIGAAGAGVGIGLSVQGALTGMARNPDTESVVRDPRHRLLEAIAIPPGDQVLMLFSCAVTE